jgi:hypothetical protein
MLELTLNDLSNNIQTYLQDMDGIVIARNGKPYIKIVPGSNAGITVLKRWKGLTTGMKNPIHVGKDFRKYSREELHER